MNYYARVGIGFAALVTATLAASAATQHDNAVYFALAGVQSFTFTETSHSVTSGQPYGGTYSRVSKPSAEGQIVVKAGRKGSSSVANWFKNQVGAGQTLVCDSTATFPDSLNFAVEGTLTMTVGTETVTCQNIIVAQGNFTTVNNWWMGGPQMTGAHISFSGATVQSCAVKGSIIPQLVLFSPATPCVNHFNIALIF